MDSGFGASRGYTSLQLDRCMKEQSKTILKGYSNLIRVFMKMQKTCYAEDLVEWEMWLIAQLVNELLSRPRPPYSE